MALIVAPLRWLTGPVLPHAADRVRLLPPVVSVGERRHADALKPAPYTASSPCTRAPAPAAVPPTQVGSDEDGEQAALAMTGPAERPTERTTGMAIPSGWAAARLPSASGGRQRPTVGADCGSAKGRCDLRSSAAVTLTNGTSAAWRTG